jgi:hypothetical protein
MQADLPEKDETLWLLAASPTIWAAHFLLSYCTAAIWCAKLAGPDGSLSRARAIIGVYTVLALAGVGIIGWRGWRRHRLAGSDLPHDDDSPEDRHRFLGFAAALLSGLSAVAILYEALAVVLIERCR